MDNSKLYKRLEYLSELIEDGNDTEEVIKEYTQIQKQLFPNYDEAKKKVEKLAKDIKPMKETPDFAKSMGFK